MTTRAAVRPIIRFAAPWNPPSALSPNSRTSTRTKRRLITESRDIAIVMAREAMHAMGDPDPYAGPVAASVTFLWAKGRRTQDLDNCVGQAKGVLDALEFVGAIVNDRQIQRISVQQGRCPDGRGEIVIEIEGIEP